MSARAASVVLLAPSLQRTPGGIARYTADLLASPILQQRGFSLLHVATHKQGSIPLKAFAAAAAGVQLLVRARKAGIVHAQMASGASCIRKLALLTEARVLGTRTIAHMHGSTIVEWLDALPTGVRNAVLRSLGANDVVVTLGGRLSAYLASHGVRTAIRAIPNGVATQPPRAGPGLTDPYILSAGRLGARKGTPELLRAFSLIHKDFPQLRLVLAGDGDTDEAVVLANSLGISAAVRVPGWQSSADLAGLLSAATAFVLPSRQEGMALAVLEAMMRGVPVIATPVGEQGSVLEHRRTGWLVQPGDPEGLSRALRELLVDPDLAHRIGMAARATAVRRFDIQVNHEAVADVYESLVGQQKAKPAQRQ